MLLYHRRKFKWENHVSYATDFSETSYMNEMKLYSLKILEDTGWSLRQLKEGLSEETSAWDKVLCSQYFQDRYLGAKLISSMVFENKASDIKCY